MRALKGDPQGQYVDDYKYIDPSKPGIRRVNSRMRNVYDQSRQEAYNPGRPGQLNDWWLIPAAIVTIAIWLFGIFVVPHIQHMFPFNFLWFLQYKLSFSSLFHIFIVGLFGGGITLGYFFAQQDLNQVGLKASGELLANDYNDAYIEMPNEMPRDYDVVPDNKVHFDIDVTAILSHMMIRNTVGIHGKDNNVRFDNKFSQELFDLASLPRDKQVRILYDAAKLAYNPNNENYDKSPDATVKDLINNHWYVPNCEDPNSQDPAGVYVVSTAPENTVVVAETRGGKGQKYIEPILDVWSRQKEQPNIVATDLKMELLRKSLKTFTIRGYNVRALNLLVANKTDSINFIGYAVDAAIRGDVTHMEELVGNIADIYFPKGGGSQDPMWNNAASTVFKRTVYGLIDYYNEEVHKLQRNPNLTSETIAQKSDEIWGHVTLFNAYKFIIETAAKTYPKDVYKAIYPTINGHDTDPDPQTDFKSGLTIYFDATAALPQNPIREKIANQDKALKSSAKSEKMLASIYGICLFSMIFFTDNKVIKLTSARPSQNLDLTGFSFPRRVAVKFNHIYAVKHGYLHSMVTWECYHDPQMTKKYEGKDYFAESDVDEYGWADGYFKGKFEAERTYLKLTIYDQATYQTGSPDNLKIAEYDFIFKKGYRKTSSGREYVIDPITGKRQIQGGTMTEYNWDSRSHKIIKLSTTFNQDEHSLLLSAKGAVQTVKYRIISSYDIHYSDNPTALFLVAPPSTASYNKILLITIDMLYNQQVSASYIGVSNQKPFYLTKYMLDEFGNMVSSDGTGIPDLSKKLTSGLGQGQQFTMILQSLAQFSAVYAGDGGTKGSGESIAETLQANSASYVFIKSKDKQMIQQLIDMNGKKHVTQESSQSFDTPAGGYRLLDSISSRNGQGPQVPHITKTTSRDERAVISENDYLRLNNKVTDGNMIVSRGTNPIWSQQSTIMPMGFKLLAHRTAGQGDDIVPKNLPMASDDNDNYLSNIPDVEKMILNRINEAIWAPKVVAQYKKVEHKTDLDIQRMDAETYADRIMAGIHANMAEDERKKKEDKDKPKPKVDDDNDKDTFTPDGDLVFNDKFSGYSPEKQDKLTDKSLALVDRVPGYLKSHQASIRDRIRQNILGAKSDMASHQISIDDLRAHESQNEDVPTEEELMAKKAQAEKKIFAGGRIAPMDLAGAGYQTTGAEDDLIELAYADTLGSFKQDANFMIKQGETGGPNSLYDRDGRILYILDRNPEANEPTDRYFATKDFCVYLSRQDTWKNIANGAFDDQMGRYFDIRERNRQVSNED